MTAAQSGRTVNVPLGPRSYSIVIRPHSLRQAGELLESWPAIGRLAGQRVLVAVDAVLADSHGTLFRESLAVSGAEVQTVLIPPGESSKSWQQAQRLYDALVEMSADRGTIVAAVGGGVTGDLAGFAAATYARGLRFVQVPTTLLSMVDSSVGGKTGINHPKGKNLIGAFHQPAGVIIDEATLATLPDRDYRSGLAEVVKYGVILDAEFFELLERNATRLLSRDSDILNTVIARSCELKAMVVQQDEYETTGLRAVLNYGHTFGHAFEALAGYGELLHGEAVAIGMLCASRLAERLGRIEPGETRRQQRLLESLGLPTTVPESIRQRPEDVLRCMWLDKKTEGRQLRFVLPDRIGHVAVVKGVAPELA
ncbi:MAG: 3-dehydroquinate synthase, partial [Planctomycetota bacterium]